MRTLKRTFSGSVSCSKTKILMWRHMMINDVEQAEDRFLYKNNAFCGLEHPLSVSYIPMHALLLFLFFLFPTHTHNVTAVFISMSMAVLNGCWSAPGLVCLCMFVCLCVLIVQWSKPGGAARDVWKHPEGDWKREGGKAVEDTVSFSGGMSSCVFLFGEAAHGSQKLAGNHMLLTLGPDKKEEARGGRREERGGRRDKEKKWGCGKGGREGCFSKPSGR